MQILFKHMPTYYHNHLFLQIIPDINSLIRKAVSLDVTQTSTLFLLSSLSSHMSSLLPSLVPGHLLSTLSMFTNLNIVIRSPLTFLFCSVGNSISYSLPL